MASSRRFNGLPVTIAIAAIAAVVLLVYAVQNYRYRESRALIGVLLSQPSSDAVANWARQDGARVRHTAATPVREEELDVCLREKATFLIWFGDDGHAQNWARAANPDLCG
jgi:hypothetical protein